MCGVAHADGKVVSQTVNVGPAFAAEHTENSAAVAAVVASWDKKRSVKPRLFVFKQNMYENIYIYIFIFC